MKTRIREKQQEALSQFYGNFALAWFTFGIISPFFSPIDDLVKLISRTMFSLIVGLYFLRTSLTVFEK